MLPAAWDGPFEPLGTIENSVPLTIGLVRLSRGRLIERLSVTSPCIVQPGFPWLAFDFMRSGLGLDRNVAETDHLYPASPCTALRCRPASQ